MIKCPFRKWRKKTRLKLGQDSLLAIVRRIAFQTNSKKYKLLERVKCFSLKSQGHTIFLFSLQISVCSFRFFGRFLYNNGINKSTQVWYCLSRNIEFVYCLFFSSWSVKYTRNKKVSKMRALMTIFLNSYIWCRSKSDTIVRCWVLISVEVAALLCQLEGTTNMGRNKFVGEEMPL